MVKTYLSLSIVRIVLIVRRSVWDYVYTGIHANDDLRGERSEPPEHRSRIR